MKENTFKKAQGRLFKPHRTGNKKKITYLSSKENNDRKGLNKKKQEYGGINKNQLNEKDLKGPKRTTTDAKQI